MNNHLLNEEVQEYIGSHTNADSDKIALAKSPFLNITSKELATQIVARKKSVSKLPTWFKSKFIYYPATLSIEQCSSESTALYKSKLIKGNSLIDLTSGFGVDSYYFSQQVREVLSCEINEELSKISKHNAQVLNANNINVLAVDGIEYLKKINRLFSTIYIDPARRNQRNKVFKLKDCTPDVTLYLDFFLTKAERIIIKTSPLLDITAGLSELKNVSEIHIVSVKNECKELLWVIDKNFNGEPIIICATINEETKMYFFPLKSLKTKTAIVNTEPQGYLYEPDVAVLKSGAFNLIAEDFELHKLHQQTQLYFSEQIKPKFLGRIFEINSVMSINALKKEKNLIGNVIVRNYPEKPETLIRKYKIMPTHDDFLIFTQNTTGFIVIKVRIIQHY